jgi:putative transposase
MTRRIDDDADEQRRGDLLPVRGPGSVRDWAEELVARAREDGVALTGEGGLLTDMVRQVLQAGLEVEMAEHLGYLPHERAGRGSGNSRNGSYDKTVTTEIGEVDLRVPRDRAGTFEPVTVPKHQRRLDGLSGNVISLYAKGLTTGDIQQHLLEIYGTEVSRETISKITDAVVEDMVAWQNRPLDPVYAVLLIDCLVIKVRGSLSPPGFDGGFEARVSLVEGEARGHAESEEVSGGVVGARHPVGVRVGPSDHACCC